MCSTWNSTQCYVAAWMGVGRGLGKTNTGIYTPVFLSCSPETNLNQPYPNTTYKFKRFHICTLIYNTFLSLSVFFYHLMRFFFLFFKFYFIFKLYIIVLVLPNIKMNPPIGSREGGGRGVQEGGDICIPMADSC